MFIPPTTPIPNVEMAIRIQFVTGLLPAVYQKHSDLDDEDVALIAWNIADAMLRRVKEEGK